MTKHTKIVMGVLAVMLVASLALAVMAFAAPAPVRTGPPQPLGWDCYGYVCFYNTDRCPSTPDNFYWCMEWCVSVPGGHWQCLGSDGCKDGC